jgi:xanthine dehydrogenase YagR molybdenum-binding subunit
LRREVGASVVEQRPTVGERRGRQTISRGVEGSLAVGAPVSRIDGIAKVTGRAHYSAEIHLENVAYACVVQSTIAKGRIKKVDAIQARNATGVLCVLTHENRPRLHMQEKNPYVLTIEGRLPLQDDEVLYAGQHIALVVAETLEQAAYAASLVDVEYEEQKPALDMVDDILRARKPATHTHTDIPMQLTRGMGAAAFGSQAVNTVSLERTYVLPVEHHNPMETSATTAVWRGANQLTIYDSTQAVVGARDILSQVFGIPKENVRVISRFIGGGFGSKGNLGHHPILAALASMVVGRPVKLVLSRKELFSSTGHRAATLQRIALLAKETGRLVALSHDVLSETSFVGDFFEPSGACSAMLYSCPNVSITHKAVPVNIAPPTYMRAPGEASGTFALESAIDELACELGIDPIELRMINYARRDPYDGKPWSGKHLDECYEVGARAFHWRERRKAAPRSVRDGRHLVGMGMATAVYHAGRMPASARVSIFPDGSVVVSTASQDIGTGTYTIAAQVAADTLGVPLGRVRVELGDTRFPPAPRSAGSMTTASVTPAVQEACQDAVRKLAKLSKTGRSAEFRGVALKDIVAREGTLSARGRGSRSASAAAEGGGVVSYSQIIARHGLPFVQGEAQAALREEEEEKFSFYSFGAQFAEVRVDQDLGEVSVSRFLGVYDTGRILNAKTGRSQFIGGIVWGIGMALMEETHYDQVHGRVVNSNLADYLVPVNGDVPRIEVRYIDKPDSRIDSLGARGIGEIGITGAAAAIANAVYNATGIRVRELPITPDKLMRLGL